MKLAKALLLGSLIATPGFAVAAAGSVQFGYLPMADLTIDDDFGEVTVDGDGYSLQGSVTINGGVFAYADYYAREISESGATLDFDTTRVGVGYAFEDSPFYIGANYERLKLGFDDSSSESSNGFGLRAGLVHPFAERFFVTGELGYSVLEEENAADVAFGLGISLTEQFALFTDYRYTLIEPDDDEFDTEISVADWRIGVRLSF